jgi:hypothetical protein
LTTFVKSSVPANPAIVNLSLVTQIYLSEDHFVEVAGIDTNRKVDLFMISFECSTGTIVWKYNSQADRDRDFKEILSLGNCINLIDILPAPTVEVDQWSIDAAKLAAKQKRGKRIKK